MQVCDPETETTTRDAKTRKKRRSLHYSYFERAETRVEKEWKKEPRSGAPQGWLAMSQAKSERRSRREHLKDGRVALPTGYSRRAMK
jgi:hypothetical protein